MDPNLYGQFPIQKKILSTFSREKSSNFRLE